jgi:DNA-binding NtrC family response regulator
LHNKFRKVFFVGVKNVGFGQNGRPITRFVEKLVMSDLSRVENLQHAGLFSDALNLLATISVGRDIRVHASTLQMELLEKTGRYNESRALAKHLLEKQSLPLTYQSKCESVLAFIEAEESGLKDKALKRLQRSLYLAERSQDLRQICWCQLRLISTVADVSGHLAAAPLIASARNNAIKLGDATVLAALHIFVGEVEAKRGLVAHATRHTNVGHELLRNDTNVWLEGLAENTLIAIAIMLSEYEEGIRLGKNALSLAAKSGNPRLQSSILGNLGNLHYRIGQHTKALDYFDRANGVLPFKGERGYAYLESLARLCMIQENLPNALNYLDRIDETVQGGDWLLHANRHAKLTRAEILVQQERFAEALEASDQAIVLAERADDNLVKSLALLTKAELLHRSGELLNALSILTEIGAGLRSQPPELHARYELALGQMLSQSGHNEAARLHVDGAKRIYQALSDSSGALELRRAESALFAVGHPKNSVVSASESGRISRDTLQDVARLLLHSRRPDLLAIEIVSILADTQCALSAKALAFAPDGSFEVLNSFEGQCGPAMARIPKRNIGIGSSENLAIEVALEPFADLESTAALNAIMLILSVTHELRQTEAERDRLRTLWPADEIQADEAQAVSTGRFADVMSFARRVAGTNVSVLVTGESGTGKEIIARAIHSHSSRAGKPFVPFNCTAIPREMLESQLFGHRRGAFTGADRENPGLIRSAKEGTLFLDEIGELNIDLQPKLLRFLESGEICPLGEPSPMNVNVRIVAATNCQLDQLVQDGRFREDLYYRLNVVRLTVPPLRERRDEIPSLAIHFLARAATEFSKGRLRLSEETVEHLVLYRWPGNVRQLQNEIRRMAALADVDATLQPSNLSDEIRRMTVTSAIGDSTCPEMAVPLIEKLTPTLSRIESEMIKAALRANQGKVDATAKALGISRKGLYLKRQRLGL